jgi:hypothetical protein
MTFDSGHLWVARAWWRRIGVNRVAVERVDEFDATSGQFEFQLPRPAALGFFSERVAVRSETP